MVENGYVLRWESKKGNPIKTAPQKLKQAEYFLFLLNTGLRAGEARALKYSDINFETRRMEISRNFTTTRTRDAEGNTVGGMTYVEGKPKTKSSARVLYLSLAALEYLKRLKAQEPEGYDGYIANSDGNPLNDAAFRRRFNSLLTQAGVPHCGLHSLRHTFASYFYEYTNGNRKVVADYLGHSISNLTERMNGTTHRRMGVTHSPVRRFQAALFVIRPIPFCEFAESFADGNFGGEAVVFFQAGAVGVGDGDVAGLHAD